MITFISFLIVLFGSVNWLSIGMLQYDIIAGFFGTQSNIFSRIVYILFGFAAIWLVISAIRQKGKINIVKDRLNTKKLEEKEDELAEKMGQKPNPNDWNLLKKGNQNWNPFFIILQQHNLLEEFQEVRLKDVEKLKPLCSS